MAKIDKFLENMVGRGAPVMRLDPGDPPMLEFPGGHRTAMSSMDILGTVLDGLAKEILPTELEIPFLRGEKVNFEYVRGSEQFQILLCRTNLVLASSPDETRPLPPPALKRLPEGPGLDASGP